MIGNTCPSLSLSTAASSRSFSLDALSTPPPPPRVANHKQVMSPTGSKGLNLGVDVISPRDFEGKVDFRKVHFTYPTRPDMHVLSGLDLTLRAGEVTALVSPEIL